jgi:predicted neuraminidase
MHRLLQCLLATGSLLGLLTQADGLPTAVPIRREFISENFPTPSNHASTVVEAADGSLQSAWFGGTAEGRLDVVIWHSRWETNGWTRPTIVARGEEDGDQPYPCWNPVLFQLRNGPLVLFYKVGPKPWSWWGRYRLSFDHGRSWSPSQRISGPLVGPVRNKPIQLADGTLLCGSSDESSGWRVHIETVQGLGTIRPFWKSTGDLNYAIDFGAIQPTVIPWSDQRIQILCRTRQQVITECWSSDAGKTWSTMKKTSLPNPNSAIDAVRLSNGKAVLIHNPKPDARTPLIASFSVDGTQWTPAVTLENEPGAELSYPAVIQTSDGLIHVTYTWKREKIRHVVLDPAQFQ